MAIFAHIIFWILLWFGRDNLSSLWRWGLIIGWLIMYFGSSFISGGSSFFMTVVTIIDIGLILIIFGRDIKIR